MSPPWGKTPPRISKIICASCLSLVNECHAITLSRCHAVMLSRCTYRRNRRFGTNLHFKFSCMADVNIVFLQSNNTEIG